MQEKKIQVNYILKICIAVALLIVTFLIINVYAGGTAREIMDEKTLVKMTATTAKLKNAESSIDSDSLQAEFEYYVGANVVTVTDKTADIILVKFLKTGNEYEVSKISSLGGGYEEPEDPELGEPEDPDPDPDPDPPVIPEPGELPSTTYTTPYMPSEDFHYVEGDLNDGLVIADALGNEYVWVEVPRNIYTASTQALNLDSLSGTALTNAYKKIENELKTYTSTYRNGTLYKDEFYSTDQHGFADADAYNEHKYKMLASVFKNGGFYVGRYETGIADTQPDVIDTSHEARKSETQPISDYTPVIKANAYPYNYVTNKQAQELATGMASGQYTSSLLFGVQWDLVLKYMETKAVEKGANQTTIISELNSNSTSWGNCYDNTTYNITNTSAKNYVSSWVDGPYGKKSLSKSVLLSTGASSDFSKQNIYDIAGNVYEWTLEYTSTTSRPCAYRGGCFNIDGTYRPASGRSYSVTTSAPLNYGFRVSLF